MAPPSPKPVPAPTHHRPAAAHNVPVPLLRPPPAPTAPLAPAPVGSVRVVVAAAVKLFMVQVVVRAMLLGKSATLGAGQWLVGQQTERFALLLVLAMVMTPEH